MTVIVANSNDAPTFLSVISTEPGHKILAKHPVPQSAENLERSTYHAPSGTFFTAIPVLASDQSKGILAQTDPKKGTIKLHELEGCHPHSLSIVSDTTIFLGCSSAHGPNKKPGGDMVIFDIKSGKIEGTRAGLGGNGGSTVDVKRGLYYHAATNGAMIVVDTKTRELVQKVPTWNGSRSPASISPPAASMSPPLPRTGPAMAASRCSRRSECHDQGAVEPTRPSLSVLGLIFGDGAIAGRGTGRLGDQGADAGRPA